MFALLALLVPAGWMLAVLQADLTNGSGFSASLVQDYADGTIGDHWTDGVPPVIWKARILVRGLILALVAVAPGHMGIGFANLILQAAFVGAALIVIYRATATFSGPGGALFAAAVSVASVPWGFLGVGYRVSYPYDLPALFFSAAGLAAILLRRFDLLVLTVVLGTLNKETTIFLLPSYVLAEWPAPSEVAGPIAQRRRLLWRALLLALAFVITYETPRLLLQPQPPSLVTVYGNLGTGHDSRVWANINHVLFGDPGGFIQNVWWVAMLHVPPLVFFRRLPRALKAAYVATPVFLGPLLFFANVFELRLYNELIPLGAMACAAVLLPQGRESR